MSVQVADGQGGLTEVANKRHQIVDSQGNTYTQRKKLVIENATITDDSTHDATVVTPSGGTGSSTLSGLTDVNLTNLADGQILKYDADDNEWKNVPESGGSGGHIIENASGTDLTQRDTLKFTGTLKATDDSTNEKTVISDAAEEVEWSVWNAMTEAERDAYSAGKKLDIVNVPGADGTIDADLMTLLWTNPSPTAAFAAQTISLDLTDYEQFIVDTTDGCGIGCVGVETSVNTIWYNAGNAGVVGYARFFNFTESGINVTDASSVHASGTNNQRVIPTKIYGIKKTINLKINAIASDVSTSASKCMMSDGETSVEDGITSINSDLTKVAVTISANTNFTISRNHSYYVNGIVHINLTGFITDMSVSHKIATVADLYKPTNTASKISILYDSNNVVKDTPLIQIGTNGNIMQYSSVSSGSAYISIECEYATSL